MSNTDKLRCYFCNIIQHLSTTFCSICLLWLKLHHIMNSFFQLPAQPRQLLKRHFEIHPLLANPLMKNIFKEAFGVPQDAPKGILYGSTGSLGLNEYSVLFVSFNIIHSSIECNYHKNTEWQTYKLYLAVNIHRVYHGAHIKSNKANFML